MRKYNFIGVWFLISLLVFAITPKDIFHEFHNHENEIEHIDLNCHNQHFETKHTHCPVLNQVSPIFYADADVNEISYIFRLVEYNFKNKVFLKLPVHFMFSLKAPPAFISFTS